jgi:hypothetical protein
MSWSKPNEGTSGHGVTMTVLPARCTDVIIERHIYECQIVLSGYSGPFNLLDVNDVPAPAVFDAVQIQQMNAAGRETNKFLQGRQDEYNLAMKRAKAAVVMSVRGNSRAKNALEDQRRALNLPVGSYPHVAEMLLRLRNAFNPVTTTSANAKVRKIQEYKVPVGQSLTTFIYYFSELLEELEYLRTTPVPIAERRAYLSEALDNGESDLEHFNNGIGMQIDNLTWDQIILHISAWDESRAGRKRLLDHRGKSKKRQIGDISHVGDSEKPDPKKN